MKTKRILAMTLAGILATGGLTGCGEEKLLRKLGGGNTADD